MQTTGHLIVYVMEYVLACLVIGLSSSVARLVPYVKCFIARLSHAFVWSDIHGLHF